MSFGSFLRGIAAQVNPFDNGATYGSYNPPQKKKRDDQNPFGSSQPAPQQFNQNQNQGNNTPQVQKPQNLFADLNNDLKLPGAPQNNTTGVIPGLNLKPTTPPQPGAIYQPGNPQPVIPNQNNSPQHPGFWHSLTHNPVTNVVGGVGKTVASPFVYLGKTDIINPAKELLASGNPAAEQRAVQQSNVDLGLSTRDPKTGIVSGNSLTHGLERWAANSAGALLTVAAPGASKALESGASSILPETAPSVVRTLAPKFVAGSTIGGTFNTANTVAQGDTNPLDLAKSYAIGGFTGGTLDTAAPYLNRFLPKNWLRNRGTNQAITEAESEAPIEGAATTEAVQAQNPQNIPVKAPDTPPVKIPVGTPVTDNPYLVPKIKEIGGDFNFPTMEELQKIRTTQAQDAATEFNRSARPDQTVSGFKPATVTKPYALDESAVKGAQGDVVNQYAQFLKDVGEGNGTQLVPDGEGGYIRTSNNYRTAENAGKRMTKQDWIDQAQKELESGKAEPGHQKAFNDAANPEVQSLINQGDQTAQPPVGKPITVKEVKGIPVIDKTETTAVPAANTPEATGQVRTTTAAAPKNAEAAAVAAQPTVKPPAQIPVSAETQAVLDNPKNFTKRQVAAARNQVKLAKKYVKAQTDKQAALDSAPQLAPKPGGSEGFVKTGEFRTGKRGNVIQVVHKSSEAAQGAHDAANLSTHDVLAKAQQDLLDHETLTEKTVRDIRAKLKDPNVDKNTPEGKALLKEEADAMSRHAQAMALADRTARQNGTGEQLANRFKNKLILYAQDTGKIPNSELKKVDDAENAFAEARDSANTAAERFRATRDPKDFNTWKDAQTAAEVADRQAKITEYLVAKKVLKGNSDPVALKAIQELEKNGGLYSMDAIDANMLSGTGTMARNYINTLFPRAENAAFGGVSSRVAPRIAKSVSKIRPGSDTSELPIVGGHSFRGSRIGSQIGKQQFKADVAARKVGGVGFIRRTVTAGNTVGERNIEATAYSRGFSQYKQELKTEGYKGTELNNMAEFKARTDPDGYVQQARDETLQANALASTVNSKKFENQLADWVQKKLSDNNFGNTGQQVGRFGAKAVTRVGVGFPTVIARSLIEGIKRATFGIPEAGLSTIKFLKSGNTQQYAEELSKAMQHAGTGGSLFLLGSALGKMGAISGAYPTDPAERARWEAEGRQENSINIGGQWFNIPGYLGGFALPLMLGATAGTGNIKDEATLKNAWSTVLSASPVDNIQSTLDILTGNSSAAKTKNAATSLVRSMTPAGSFLAELAKLTDRTANDTTQKDSLHNILDQVAGGIPIVNNAVNKTPKLDSYGNVIKNPNPVATVLGAQGSTQTKGTQDVNKEQGASDQTFNEMNGYGVFQDKNLTQLIDPKLYKQMQEGQQLTPQDVQKIQKSVTKGISATEDSNWREAGNYSTDKAALQVKLQMLNADPTTKPSEKKQYETQIKRDDVLQSHNIPYDALKQYESTSLSQWRGMGDPYSQSYDPDTYQKLWTVDQLMAKGGASYKTGDPSSQKYSAKQPGSARGGSRRGSSVTGDFGKLSAPTGAPTVQKYATIDTKAGNIPIITPVRPNIVHNISSSG